MHPPTSCTLVESPALVRDCLFVGRSPLISQLASISRGRSTRVRPKLGFGYGFGAETAKFLGFGLVSVTAVTCILVSAGFGYGRNLKFSFGIVTVSRNSDIEFGKHGIILQPFPNAVSACPYAKLASSGSGVA